MRTVEISRVELPSRKLIQHSGQAAKTRVLASLLSHKPPIKASLLAVALFLLIGAEQKLLYSFG